MSRGSALYAHPLGVAIGDMTAPEEIPEAARRLEDQGYSHITVPEDCFYVPALIGSTLALSATRSVPVGTSIVSALTRHPAILAMEIAGISRAFPGRFRPGIGLGLPDWLRQMGIMPDNPVAAMRGRISCLQSLLSGRAVTFEGESFALDSVSITHPAVADVPITMGVMGPKMLQLAGELADVTLFPATAGLEYIRYARSEVAIGLEKAGRRPENMAYSTIALACVDHDGAKARQTARPVLASFLAEFASMNTFSAYGISAQLRAMVERGGAGTVAAEMPDTWIEDLALVGTPDEVAEKTRGWLEAGVSSIAIFFPDESEKKTLRLVAEEVIPTIV